MSTLYGREEGGGGLIEIRALLREHRLRRADRKAHLPAPRAPRRATAPMSASAGHTLHPSTMEC